MISGLVFHGNSVNITMNFKQYISEGVDINTIETIESTGNPRAINKRSGASGATQIHNKRVWDSIVADMGQNYDWAKHRLNRGANRAVGNHYINVMIPKYLQVYKIPDTTETRLAAYNWGIGNLKKAYRTNPKAWQTLLPPETTNYIIKYNKLIGTPTTPVKPPVSAIASVATPHSSSIYVVKPNDALSKIAALHKKPANVILAANPQIKDPNKIRVGDKIIIPT